MTITQLKKIINDVEFNEDIEFIDRALRSLMIPQSSKVLDIGTGMGIMCSILTLHGFWVTTGQPKDYEEDGHNLEEHNHQKDFYTGRKVKWQDVIKELAMTERVDYKNLNILDLPFEDDSYDLVFVYDVLQHIDNIDKGIGECLRVARKGNRIFFIELNEKGVSMLNKKYNGDLDFIDMTERINSEEINLHIIRGELSNMYMLSEII